jgi:hypothetical protein
VNPPQCKSVTHCDSLSAIFLMNIGIVPKAWYIFLHFIPINNFVDNETGLSGHVVLFQMFSY